VVREKSDRVNKQNKKKNKKPGAGTSSTPGGKKNNVGHPPGAKKQQNMAKHRAYSTKGPQVTPGRTRRKGRKGAGKQGLTTKGKLERE